MGLILRRNIVAGKLIDHDVPNEEHPIYKEHRKLSSRVQETQVMLVEKLGPECEEVQVGELVILPPQGGGYLKLWDPDTEEEYEYTIIEEHVLLARITED